MIVGFGRMGGALALGLQRAGWPVSVFPRSGASLRRAVELGIPIADHDALRDAQVCLFAVPDAAVSTVASQMVLDLGLSTALVHCAGSLDLRVFGDSPIVARRMRGSFHPLVAVSDPRDALQGHAAAIAATGRPLLATLRRMADDLSLLPIEVPEAGRAAYHAGAVLAAGGLVALLSAAVDAFAEAGVPADDALRALVPLSRSALRGVQERGLARGLTGPVPRGDLPVVRAHLAALPPEIGALYRQLSLRALALCGGQLTAETQSALERLLRTP
ncbi:MAG: DUF2520 domain-containing protein [Myxococcaceae bacterium]|nr:DUF2520 domain-containing protein [Myxococcaceae bacterium]